MNEMEFKTSDFDYNLPPELIAQTPLEPRDASRLMIINRQDSSIGHRRFSELPDFLRQGDVMVFNDSRVLPARLHGSKTGSGGKVEILLLKRLELGIWEALVKPAKRLKTGASLELNNQEGKSTTATIIGENDSGIRTIQFSDESMLPVIGGIALPPYIHTPLQNPERYQTVYSQITGSVAAPTAGLHFTPQLLEQIRMKGIEFCFVTLHVGLDTFRPVQEDDPSQHQIHREYGSMSAEVAAAITRAKKENRRIICVGTTSVRLVEAVAAQNSIPQINAFNGWVDLFILPGYQFRVVDAMITNFHLPKSTLLMLVSAFAGKELIDKAYQIAIAEKYRFYSFGDATLIL